MQKLIIEGINGAGKTPTINLLTNTLDDAGIRAATYAPYHLVRDKIAEDDLFPLWDDRPQEAVTLLQHTIAEIESDARSKSLDVLVFDRHWVTAYVQSLKNPVIADWWGDNFAPTILLDSPTDHLLRLASRGYTEPWLQADALQQYVAEYDEIYQQYITKFIGKFTVSRSDQNLQPIVDQITDTIIKGELL